MNESVLHNAFARRRQRLAAWQTGAVGVLVLSAAANAVCASALLDTRERLKVSEAAYQSQAARLEQVELIRDHAIERLGALNVQIEQDRQARAEQAAAYEAVGDWEYIGKCTITAYCPCKECCGRWADGLTSSGLPAVPGIVAVDPAVIPIGSTVVIDGQKYLAADTGVTGNHVDVCLPDHQSTVVFGVQTRDVWVTACT